MSFNPIFHDTVPEIQATSNLLDKGNDIQTIERIGRLEVDIQKNYSKQQHEIKQMISSFSQQTKKVEQEMKGTKSKVEKTQQSLKQLAQEVDNVKEQVSQGMDELEVSQAKIYALDKENELSSARIAKIQQQDVPLPKIGHSLSLYSNISNIRWDFEAKSRTRGHVTVPGSAKPLRPFDFDHNHTTQYEITNRLWDLLSK